MQSAHPARAPLAASPTAQDQKVLAVGSEAPTMMAPAPAPASAPAPAPAPAPIRAGLPSAPDADLPHELKSTVPSPEPHLIAPAAGPDAASARPMAQGLN